jgi:hypothetical protein
MSKLLYHKNNLENNATSPFDEAILKVARSGNVKIISPYIGVDYFKRIIGESADWLLISDIEAWLISLNAKNRFDVYNFLKIHQGKIHHCPAIHAKAIISEHVAMFGSANFTQKGILNRAELSIFIESKNQIQELNCWFDSVWNETAPPDLQEVNFFIDMLNVEKNKIDIIDIKYSISSKVIKIKSKYEKIEKNEQDKLYPMGEIQTADEKSELKLFRSIEDKIDYLVDNFSNNSFIFKFLVENVKNDFPKTNLKQIYFLILNYCANHFRVTFSLKSINRLLLHDGIFFQSTKEALQKSLMPYDLFLNDVVNYFDFNIAKIMPEEHDFKSSINFNYDKQLIMFEQLISSDFLEMFDESGKSPRFSLNKEFDWDCKYKLFEQSKQSWNLKKSNLKNLENSINPNDFFSKKINKPSVSLNYHVEDDDETSTPPQSEFSKFMESQRLTKNTRL